MHEIRDSETNGRLRRFLSRAHAHRAFSYLVIGALLAIVLVAAGGDVERHIGAIEGWIARLGPWGVLAFIVLFVPATSCLFPESLLAIAAGALFGPALGLAAVIAGSLAAATLQYLLSRKLLRTRIQRILAVKPELAAIQRAVSRDAFRVQALLRLTPLNPAVISYLLGAAGVHFPSFLSACLAMIPNLLLEVSFGHAGTHIAHMTARAGGAVYFHDFVVVGGFGLCLLVVILISRTARKAISNAAA